MPGKKSNTDYERISNMHANRAVKLNEAARRAQQSGLGIKSQELANRRLLEEDIAVAYNHAAHRDADLKKDSYIKLGDRPTVEDNYGGYPKRKIVRRHPAEVVVTRDGKNNQRCSICDRVIFGGKKGMRTHLNKAHNDF